MTRSEKLNVRVVINEKEGDDEFKGIVLSRLWDKLPSLGNNSYSDHVRRI